jgi:alkylation response protein AidB-like acyl-CoA dehydrogenase
MILSEEQTLIADMARNFARDRLAPNAPEWDRSGEFPRAAVEEMADLGFLGMLVPEEWGGAGATNVSYALALEEIAAGDGGASTLVSVQSLVNNILLGYGSDEQKEKFLKPLASGEKLAAFCLTEPHTGSDAGAIKTRARRDGNHWVISGNKQFITTGANADLALVFAVTDPEKPRGKGISAFVVPTDSKGFEVAALEKKMGQRAWDTAQLIFDDVRVTPDMMVGEDGQGYKIALANLEGGRIGIGAQSVGMARAAYEAALAYSKEREAFGKPICQHQAVAFRLADMHVQIEAARHLVLHAAELRDAGLPCLKEASMAKLFASEMAEKVCSAAIQTHGGYGYVADFPVERIYRDVRISQIYEGTSDVQRLLISRQILAD